MNNLFVLSLLLVFLYFPLDSTQFPNLLECMNLCFDDELGDLVFHLALKILCGMVEQDYPNLTSINTINNSWPHLDESLDF